MPVTKNAMTASSAPIGSVALSGATTFEDLYNCRYSIWRPGAFNNEEYLFWNFLSGFSSYLESHREFGVGAQILKDLGVKRMRVLSAPKQMHGISAFGLEVESYAGYE